MSNSEYTYDVFLSFSHKNSKKANQIWNTLTKSGIRVFFAGEDLKRKVGQSFIEVISTALINSNHFLLIHSDHAYKSTWVKEEFETFYNECYITSDRKRKIVLFAESDYQIASIPPLFRKLQVSSEIEQLISMLGGSSLNSLQAKNTSLNEEVDYLKSKIKSLKEEIAKLQSQATNSGQEKINEVAERIIHKYVASRKRLPLRGSGFSQKAKIGGIEIELITKEWKNQQLGSILIRVAKEGPSITYLLDAFSEAITLGLQYGVPLEEFIDTYVFTKFDPSGTVNGSPHIKMTTSILDYVFRELAITYLGREDLAHVPSEEIIKRPLLPPDDID